MSRIAPRSALLAALFAAAGLVPGGPCRAVDLPSSEIRTRPSVDVDASAPNPESRFDALIGASVVSAPEYAGSSRRALEVVPLIGLRYGRFRLTSSGTARLMDFGGHGDEAGASAELLKSDAFSLRTGLRIGGGRHSSDSVDLDGIPDIRRTVLGRVTAAYRFAPGWRVSSTLAFDLLGRGNGAVLTTGLDYRRPLTGSTELYTGFGVSVANSTHMDSYFGVPAAAGTATRPAYAPGSGLRDAAVGIGLTTRLSPSWVAFGNLGYSILLSDAADSPLTRRTGGATATVGIAWRCCR